MKPIPARSVDAQLVIAVIGDYGCAPGSSCGNPTSAQETAVASMVHAWGPNAIFTVGDNSYESGCGPQNPADSSCPAGSNDIQPDQQPYLNDITNGMFYEVVGNHDAYHIQNVTTGGSGPNCPTTVNCGYLYNRPSHYVAHLGSGLLDFFATDMNSADPDGDSATSVQAQRYVSDVNASTAIWKITAGHQAFYSSGPQHGTQNYTHWAILPQIDLFLSGHDHDMEHLTYQGQHFVVSGVGGKSLYGFGKNRPCPFSGVSGVSNCPATTVWRDSVAPYHYGAVRLTITPTSLLVEFVGISSTTAAGTLLNSFTLTKPGPSTGSISGQVSDGATGIAVAGATVSYSAGSSTADATGHYVLSAVPAGVYSVTASAAGYASQTQTLTVKANTDTSQNFSLTPNPGSISGQVLDGSLNYPVAGASVSYSGGSATTDATGHYTLTSVKAGTYTVSANAPNYSSQSATVPVGPGAGVTQNFSLSPNPGSIAGQVVDATSKLALAGATVSYSAGSAITDATGHYILASVKEGAYTVTAAVGGYTSQSATVPVGPGATVTQNFSLTASPGSITGQVADTSTSAAVAGAIVSYGGGNATTDASGHYTLANVTPGTYTVTAAAGGYTSQSATVVVGRGATATQNFSLPPNPGSISGVVVDASTGTALASATVSSSGGSATTDATGHYTLVSVKEGTYTVTAAAGGYLSQSATVLVGPGATATKNFSLTPNPGSITGQVVDASSGTPLAGATVSYSGGSASTDASGHYSLANVTPGTYPVTATAGGYTSQSATVLVGRGTTAAQNFSLTPSPGSITGQVVDAITGTALAGAVVSYAGGSVTTDATGHYTLASVTAGTYTVTASFLNYSSQSAAVLVGRGAATTQNFSLTPHPGTITGQVVDASTGRALAGATVSYSGGSATTDATGHYTQASVEDGTYTVSASVLNYSSQSATVPVGPGATVTQNFSLIPNPGSITGQVVDAGTGTALAGATVSYAGGSATTDATGHYTLTSVKEGTYTVSASVPNYGGQSATVPVGPGATVTQNFSLISNHGSITGQVVDAATGVALAGATVSYSGGSATTDATGHYTLTSVKEGTYTVSAGVVNYSSQSGTVAVGPGATVIQNFSLIPNPGSITGQVVDAGTGTAVAGATVFYTGGSATTDPGGHYALTNVTPGNYEVTAAANGYNSQSMSVSVGAGTAATQNFALTLIAIFSDGFENGSLSAWTTNAGLTVETTTVHTGGYAAQASTSSSAVFARKLLSSSNADLYYRAYIYIKSQGGSGINLMYYRTATGVALLHLSISSTGKLEIRNDVLGVSTVSSIIPSQNAWHALEIHATINGTSSAVEVWLDDVHVTALEGPTDLGTTPIGMIQVGDNLGSKAYDFLVDDVVVQNSHVGLVKPRVVTGPWTR